MAPPAAVYVAAVVGVAAAVFVFKEFVYEPHIAPKLEEWAENFLQRRRAARNRRASVVTVRASRRRHSTSSLGSSHHGGDTRGDQGANDGAPRPNDFTGDELELEALAAREVDEWRNEVLRSQGRPREGLRKRRRDPLRGDFESFETMSTTFDESFTSLTHTPLAPTHVISNVSSPVTPSTATLPSTPSHRSQSDFSSMLTSSDASTLFIVSRTPPHQVLEIPAMSPSPGSTDPARVAQTDSAGHLGITPPSPLAAGGSPPLFFTTTNEVMADDSPFGPLLPDTPRSSAEIYGTRPFSPITRVTGSSSGSVCTVGSKESLPSRANSTGSVRTLGSSGVLRRSSGLANEMVANTDDDDDGSDQENRPHASASTLQSVISSLSERYPAPPTPPVIISSPISSVGVISAPSSPRSGGSEVVVNYDAMSTPHSPSHALSQTHPSLPLLQLPSDSPSARPTFLSHSPARSPTSPAASYASFLSPMPLSRAASESEGDEFLSVASDDSDWSRSPVTPSHYAGLVQDRANNPFLDFEHLTQDVRNGSEHRDTSEGSEVLVSDHGHEAGSEVGSDESWGSARRH